jgi:hypothetical protein
MKHPLLNVTLAALCGVFTTLAWSLDDKDGTDVTCDHVNAQRNPYFGDLHVHTTYSVDGFTQGVETTPEQAYRFARGEQIGLHPLDTNGQPTRVTQIDRPLDFAMVSDHAEFFGEYSICTDPGHPQYNDANCVVLRERDPNALVSWNILLAAAQNNVSRFDFCGPDGSLCTQASQDIWQLMQDTAEQFYDRSSDCTFTTFIGYEWTGAPLVVNGQSQVEIRNLHRNVLFLNSMVPDKPVSYLDQPYPENLWSALETNCLNQVAGAATCDVLTIPHNSNLSQGMMFETLKPNGQPYGVPMSARRAKFEPLIEVTQHKGQSECLQPGSNDELCNFEVVPWGHLGGNFIPPTTPRVEGTVRYALTEGLRLKDSIGNPFQYGMIGGTDTHLGTPGLVEESASYPGHGGAAGGTSGQTVIDGITDPPELNPGGLAVVWATQNSRRALFDAMRRREVYATSGPRHVVRFFAGWDLPANACSLPNLVEVADGSAVPMGGKLPPATAVQTAPKFLVTALKDAGTASHPGNDLQRIQIIKGWTDAGGAKHEKVFEVAGDPDNGAGVDTATCETSGTGFADLCQVWEDPEFNLDQYAYYYARVVENPSCRWAQRQCIAADPAINCADPGSVPEEFAACCDVNVPKTVQERSWSSPIWYDKRLPSGC